jgi:PKD repeat protein
LTAINAGGSNQTSQIVNVGTAVAAPVASFTYSGANTFAPDNVTFTSTSTNATSYSWSWGDNSANSTTATASHVFTSAGVYTVTLTVTNAGGSNSTSQTINVSPAPSKVELDTVILTSTNTPPSTTSYSAYVKILQTSNQNILYTSGNFSNLIYPNSYALSITGSSFYTFNDISSGANGVYQIIIYQKTGILSSDIPLGGVSFRPSFLATSGSNYYPTSINLVNQGTNITLKVKWIP